MSVSSKKILNSPESCVDECLKGLSLAHPQLVLHPHHRVLLDGVVNRKRKVAVISGGGAGHEPFAAGYVGPGMLTAAVSGSVFASPPSSHVMDAIQSVAASNESVFLVIPNYTGDILNFGLSIELARSQGVNIDSIVVGEDVALKSHSKTGRRGMCGMVVVFKILGHMSSQGNSLPEVKKMAQHLTDSLASFGLGVTACSLPGAGPLFELGEDEMELGVGVHGEAGVRRTPLLTAAEIIKTFLETLVPSLQLQQGSEVAVFVNNLGALTNIEQWVVAGEVHKQLTAQGITVARLVAGQLFTSLNMSGVQVCLLKLVPETRKLVLECLDAPTQAPCWPGCALSAPSSVLLQQYTERSSENKQFCKGPQLAEDVSLQVKQCIRQVTTAIANSEAKLNQLDSGCGDGDCGSTLRRLAITMRDRELTVAYPATLANELADIAQHTMGGTSGALYSLFFTSAGQELESLTDISSAETWGRAWRAGLQGMKKYSAARVGDRTMFDSLEPAYLAFEKSLSTNSTGLKALSAAVLAANQGCIATSTMKASAGRASYVEESQLKEMDAGAYAVTVWLTALLRSFE